MATTHLIEVKVDEEGYAAESGAAFEAAEAAATEYPVIYPEPFATLGCGYGQAGKFVLKACTDLANEFGFDWESCNQTEVLVTLYCGTTADYLRYEVELKNRLGTVANWAKFAPTIARQLPRQRG